MNNNLCLKGEKGEPGNFIRGSSGIKGEIGLRGPVGPMGPSGLQPDITKYYRIKDLKSNEIIKLYPKKSNTHYNFNKTLKIDKNSFIINFDNLIDNKDFIYNFFSQNSDINNVIEKAYNNITINITLGGNLPLIYNMPYYKFINIKNKTTYDNQISPNDKLGLEIINTFTTTELTDLTTNPIYISININL